MPAMDSVQLAARLKTECPEQKSSFMYAGKTWRKLPFIDAWLKNSTVLRNCLLLSKLFFQVGSRTPTLAGTVRQHWREA
jgi:hypothetical protein